MQTNSNNSSLFTELTSNEVACIQGGYYAPNYFYKPPTYSYLPPAQTPVGSIEYIYAENVLQAENQLIAAYSQSS